MGEVSRQIKSTGEDLPYFTGPVDFADCLLSQRIFFASIFIISELFSALNGSRTYSPNVHPSPPSFTRPAFHTMSHLSVFSLRLLGCCSRGYCGSVHVPNCMVLTDKVVASVGTLIEYAALESRHRKWNVLSKIRRCG